MGGVARIVRMMEKVALLASVGMTKLEAVGSFY